jgi:ADP-ribosylglycohydrolase
MSLSLGDRLAGCILGQALGDAIGFVVEGHPPEQAVAYVAGWVRTGRADQRSRDPFPFGQYSDDTQLARELLLAFRDGGDFDPARFAARIADLFGRGADVGAGPGTRGTAHRLLLGVPWAQAATPAPYAGNGAAMRAGPLGLLARDADELVQVAVTQSRVTHADPRCAAGAVTVAGAVALAAGSGAIQRSEFLEQLSELVAPVDAGFASALGGLAGWAPLDPEEALTELHRRRFDAEAAPHWRGITGHVVPSVLWSLYAFLRAPDDYLEAVSTAVAAGGDTDTTAAMAGAIAGARLGPAAAPATLLGRLTDRGEWGCEALEELARECSTDRSAGPDLG